MAKFESLRNSAIRPDQMADILESFVAGKPIEEIAHRHKLKPLTIDNYIYRHYFGIIPKEDQIKVTLESKV